jgi:hypothetical protein
MENWWLKAKRPPSLFTGCSNNLSRLNWSETGELFGGTFECRFFIRVRSPLRRENEARVAVGGGEIGCGVKLHRVKSTSIAAIGYERRARVMVVTFLSGGAYAYLEVPAAVYAGFRKAKSAGRFFTSRVRDRFAFVKVDL